MDNFANIQRPFCDCKSILITLRNIHKTQYAAKSPRRHHDYSIILTDSLDRFNLLQMLRSCDNAKLSSTRK
jgi:hypothetical protein